ncbi:MAG: TOBE domain-containing protein [Candidatus Helarchaeota archaeon]|nr:TOBE domain-containing protein [Candidatus Helarchaeota archaeon]
MKISARNKIKTVIKEIKSQELIATLCLSLAEPCILTAVITKDAAEDMDVKVGDTIKVIVKPTEIFIQDLKLAN